MDIKIVQKMLDAISSNDLECIKNLVFKKDFNINEKTVMGTFLQAAICEKNDEIAIFLIEEGIDINCIAGVTKSSALTDAVFMNNKKIVAILCENGAKLDVTTTKNNPLFFAISGRKVEIAKYLIDAGIDIYATYKIGEIENCDACEWAKKWGTKDVYDYLIEKETTDAKLFEVTASTSFESLCKIVKDTKDLYNADEKIICTAKGRRQLIEASAKGVSFRALN